MWSTIIQLAMDGERRTDPFYVYPGVRDPLSVFFMDELSAKDEVIRDLRHEIQLISSENAALYEWFSQAQERFTNYSRMIRATRNRIWYLERRLAELGELTDPEDSPIETINLVSDSE